MKRKKGERIKGISGCDEMKGYEYLLPVNGSIITIIKAFLL
jgi:hypothetical protein